MLYFGLPIVVDGKIIAVDVQQGETPFPDGALFPVPTECRDMEAKFLTAENGLIRAKTPEEILKEMPDGNIQ